MRFADAVIIFKERLFKGFVMVFFTAVLYK